MKNLKKMNMALTLFDNSVMTYDQIAETLGVSRSTVSRWISKHRSAETCDKRFRDQKSRVVSGAKHPNYRTGRSVQGRYATVLKPEWYTGRKNCRRVYEHHVVFCEAYGMTEIPSGMCVHHRNGDKLDNRIENLELMTLEDHTRLHNSGATTIPEGSRPKRAEAHGTLMGDDIVCSAWRHAAVH